eukprot:TRINITY_DN42103_c0_g2_i1.p1 TRINITY_DN42103_c0_g2~~TRINITY_DN42103_c0_g2_i1.p1  ORF type:complete len:1098 (-),score=270.61 TRINITY_DN42103_c0_g2_i1:418-3288(-)
MSDIVVQGAVGDAENAVVVHTGGAGALRKDLPPFEAKLVALPLPRRPLFPGQQQLLQVTHPAVIKEITALLEKGTPPFIGAFLHKSAEEGATPPIGDPSEAPILEDLSGSDPLGALHNIGTRARIVQIAHAGKFGPVESHGGGMQMLLYGIDLIRMEKVLDMGPPLQVKVSRMKYSSATQTDDIKAYINETMHTIREIMKINPQFREHAAMIHSGIERLERGDPHAIAHFAASLTTSTGLELMGILEAEDPAEKLRLSLVLLKKELELSQLQQKIATQIEEKVSGKQREYMLREQLNQIRKELGEGKDDGTEALLTKFRKRLETRTVPTEVREAIDAEIDKFSSLSKESQEYQMTRNYLDWLTIVPWGEFSKDTLNMARAQEILDRDHYGLKDIKERILELIAVGALRGSVQGKIICFVGPPGVGKTSIGRSIAEALGREFYRFSVGGLYDVAEIKGHRRTYVGSMPGKIIQCLKKVQTQNPLVLIDEVDKIGRGHQGDPASALLELLDPSQNSGFLDHYLDVPTDCSRILFVCTANVTDTIPGPLLDRMEVIRLSGYDHQEKVKIAENYLLPNAMRDAGLWPPLPEKEAKAAAKEDTLAATAVEQGDVGAAVAAVAEPEKEEAPKAEPVKEEKFDVAVEISAVEALIRWYCREAGVRNLQKHIEKICRKLATKVVQHREEVEARTLPTEEASPEKTEEAAPPSASETASTAASEASSTTPAALEENDGVSLRVTADVLSDYVGKPIFTSDRLYEEHLPKGVVTGLAWTAMGGAVLYVEATALPRPERARGNTPALSVTGQLGSVMKESSQIALLVARQAAAKSLAGDRATFFEDSELYVHFPEGATPKDGPSAGVTMVTSLMSLALETPVRADLAMTGEVTLNGRVLPVGGIREKTIAARRAGCKALVFPKANRRDFDELPDYIKEGLDVHFVEDYKELVPLAFPDLPGLQAFAS